MTTRAMKPRARREPIYAPDYLDKLRAWCRRPFSPLAEYVTPAVVGSVTFILFVIAAAIGG